MQLGIILCASVRSCSMVETRVKLRTEVQAMLAINEAPKDFYFGILWRCRPGQESGTGKKILGHGQTVIGTELRYFSWGKWPRVGFILNKQCRLPTPRHVAMCDPSSTLSPLLEFYNFTMTGREYYSFYSPTHISAGPPM